MSQTVQHLCNDRTDLLDLIGDARRVAEAEVKGDIKTAAKQMQTQ